MKPRRVRLSRKAGWKKPPNTAVVTRSSKHWGNPYRKEDYPGEAGWRALAVEDFRKWIHADEQAELRRLARRELAGKNLACWCPLDGPCHADVWLEIANAEAELQPGEVLVEVRVH